MIKTEVIRLQNGNEVDILANFVFQEIVDNAGNVLKVMKKL